MEIKLIERLALGAFVGCFVVMLVMVLGSYAAGPENVSFSGLEVINAFLGSIVVGWAFSLSGLIYEKEEVPVWVFCLQWQFTCSGCQLA